MLPFLGPEAAARELEHPPARDDQAAANPQVDREIVAERLAARERASLLRALTETVGDYGYQEATVHRLIARARVSRDSFYQLFCNREQCFLTAYDEIAESLLGRIEESMRGEGPPDERLRSGIGVLRELCVREPDMARLVLVEVLSEGHEGRARRERTMRRLAELAEAPLRELRPTARLATVGARALVGAVHELLYDPVDRRDPDALPELDTLVAAAGVGASVRV